MLKYIMAGRKKTPYLTDDWKTKIKVAHIINRLHAYFNGEVNLEPGQVNAAKILLAKSLPDLSHADVNASHDGKIVVEIVKFYGKE